MQLTNPSFARRKPIAPPASFPQHPITTGKQQGSWLRKRQSSASQTLRRLSGKGWSVLRLIKAAFTFQGGADYIVWKIERHSGEKIILTDWQRRHPVIAGLLLLPALLRKGAVR